MEINKLLQQEQNGEVEIKNEEISKSQEISQSEILSEKKEESELSVMRKTLAEREAKLIERPAEIRGMSERDYVDEEIIRQPSLHAEVLINEQNFKNAELSEQKRAEFIQASYKVGNEYYMPKEDAECDFNNFVIAIKDRFNELEGRFLEDDGHARSDKYLRVLDTMKTFREIFQRTILNNDYSNGGSAELTSAYENMYAAVSMYKSNHRFSFFGKFRRERRALANETKDFLDEYVKPFMNLAVPYVEVKQNYVTTSFEKSAEDVSRVEQRMAELNFVNGEKLSYPDMKTVKQIRESTNVVDKFAVMFLSKLADTKASFMRKKEAVHVTDWEKEYSISGIIDDSIQEQLLTAPPAEQAEMKRITFNCLITYANRLYEKVLTDLRDMGKNFDNLSGEEKKQIQKKYVLTQDYANFISIWSLKPSIFNCFDKTMDSPDFKEGADVINVISGLFMEVSPKLISKSTEPAVLQKTADADEMLKQSGVCQRRGDSNLVDALYSANDRILAFADKKRFKPGVRNFTTEISNPLNEIMGMKMSEDKETYLTKVGQLLENCHWYKENTVARNELTTNRVAEVDRLMEILHKYFEDSMEDYLQKTSEKLSAILRTPEESTEKIEADAKILVESFSDLIKISAAGEKYYPISDEQKERVNAILDSIFGALYINNDELLVKVMDGFDALRNEEGRYPEEMEDFLSTKIRALATEKIRGDRERLTADEEKSIERLNGNSFDRHVRARYAVEAENRKLMSGGEDPQEDMVYQTGMKVSSLTTFFKPVRLSKEGEPLDAESAEAVEYNKKVADVFENGSVEDRKPYLGKLLQKIESIEIPMKILNEGYIKTHAQEIDELLSPFRNFRNIFYDDVVNYSIQQSYDSIVMQRISSKFAIFEKYMKIREEINGHYADFEEEEAFALLGDEEEAISKISKKDKEFVDFNKNINLKLYDEEEKKAQKQRMQSLLIEDGKELSSSRFAQEEADLFREYALEKDAKYLGVVQKVFTFMSLKKDISQNQERLMRTVNEAELSTDDLAFLLDRIKENRRTLTYLLTETEKRIRIVLKDDEYREFVERRQKAHDINSVRIMSTYESREGYEKRAECSRRINPNIDWKIQRFSEINGEYLEYRSRSINHEEESRLEANYPQMTSSDKDRLVKGPFFNDISVDFCGFKSLQDALNCAHNQDVMESFLNKDEEKLRKLGEDFLLEMKDFDFTEEMVSTDYLLDNLEMLTKIRRHLVYSNIKENAQKPHIPFISDIIKQITVAGEFDHMSPEDQKKKVEMDYYEKCSDITIGAYYLHGMGSKGYDLDKNLIISEEIAGQYIDSAEAYKEIVKNAINEFSAYEKTYPFFEQGVEVRHLQRREFWQKTRTDNKKDLGTKYNSSAKDPGTINCVVLARKGINDLKTSLRGIKNPAEAAEMVSNLDRLWGILMSYDNGEFDFGITQDIENAWLQFVESGEQYLQNHRKNDESKRTVENVVTTAKNTVAPLLSHVLPVFEKMEEFGSRRGLMDIATDVNKVREAEKKLGFGIANYNQQWPAIAQLKEMANSEDVYERMALLMNISRIAVMIERLDAEHYEINDARYRNVDKEGLGLGVSAEFEELQNTLINSLFANKDIDKNFDAARVFASLTIDTSLNVERAFQNQMHIENVTDEELKADEVKRHYIRSVVSTNRSFLEYDAINKIIGKFGMRNAESMMYKQMALMRINSQYPDLNENVEGHAYIGNIGKNITDEEKVVLNPLYATFIARVRNANATKNPIPENQ